MQRKLTGHTLRIVNAILLTLNLNIESLMKKYAFFIAAMSFLALNAQNKFGFEYTGIYKLIENGDSLPRPRSFGLRC